MAARSWSRAALTGPSDAATAAPAAAAAAALDKELPLPTKTTKPQTPLNMAPPQNRAQTARSKLVAGHEDASKKTPRTHALPAQRQRYADARDKDLVVENAAERYHDAPYATRG